MKNITVSIDEETYRRARVAAAERDTSVSRLVREYLESLGTDQAGDSDVVSVLFAALDTAKDFRASERMSRDETHARGRLP
jgi:hypothetical protein